MNIYRQKFYWKIGLLFLAIFIVLVSLYYSNNLAKKLSEEERKKVELYGHTQNEMQRLSKFDTEMDLLIKLLRKKELNGEIDLSEVDIKSIVNFIDYSYLVDIIKSNTTIPVIIKSDSTQSFTILNLEVDELKSKEDTSYFLEILKTMSDNYEPVEISITETKKQLLYYDDSSLLKQLKWYPYIQLGTIGAFLLIAYLAFSSARRAEQDHVWVGMARETAHQLGTPLSSLAAWIEMLRENDDPAIAGVGNEMVNDTNRLTLIADRFSKIGSKPKLEIHDLNEQLEKTFGYVKRRAAKKITFSDNFDQVQNLKISFSPPLLDWVLENLLKNALDAMEKGEGHISIELEEKENTVQIEVSDTGKGIKGNTSDVFKPGFSTKKRGWGLGLSLSKRIVEEYHKGKIFVQKSAPGKGTTFMIILPK